MQEYKAVLISDFTSNTFKGYLENDSDLPKIQVASAPFGQVMQTLADDRFECWNIRPDLVVLWTRPDGVIEKFGHALQFENVSLAEILAEVDAYCDVVRNIRDRAKWIMIPTWNLPPYQRGLGALDLQPGGGIGHALMHMNTRLVQNFESEPNCIVLDAQRWVARVGERKAFNPKLWYLGKIAFSTDVYKEAVRDIKAATRGLSGKAKKLIVLDLDDTLWSGIVGEVGWEQLGLGGHDAVGEAFVDFQRALKSLRNRGILLAIVSKNEESVALEAIRKHPEMVLREDDFAGWKINWRDKAANIEELVSELNLGLDSVVFIDDNPVERARVKDALPGVFVPDWPKDKLLYVQVLSTLDCFDSGSVSSEDRQRAGMYKAERERTTLRNTVGSIDGWLETLNTRVVVETLNKENLARVAQLFNKTNQMNLTTRRMTAAELLDWTSGGERQIWGFRTSDRFGDSGLTGIVGVEAKGDTLEIVDFILSCRVMGRRIEEAMLSVSSEYGRARGLKLLSARYIETAKNKPCLSFFEHSGLAASGSVHFSWDLTAAYPAPAHVQIVTEASCLSAMN
jgi:FkbH-like protein